MELSNEEVEQYLHSIFTGQKFVEIEDKLFLFKHPNNEDKMRAELIYRKAYDRALKDGMLKMEDLDKLIRERNIFSQDDQNRLDNLYSKLNAQKVLLSKTTKVRARQDRIKEIIHKIQSEINQLESKRTSKLSLSAESKSEEERATYLCWACSYVYTEDGPEKYWKTFDALSQERNLNLKDQVLINFLKFRGGIKTEIIRHIARHSLWRIRYVTSLKVSEPLFGVPTSQYTNDMLNLAYWSNFYQNVYEMMPKDRPPDEIIEDDEALDAYMTEFYKERSREAAIERDKAGNKARLSAFDKEEVIVTKSNELYQDIDYDTPREAQLIKDKAAIRKKAKKRRR